MQNNDKKIIKPQSVIKIKRILNSLHKILFIKMQQIACLIFKVLFSYSFFIARFLYNVITKNTFLRLSFYCKKILSVTE